MQNARPFKGKNQAQHPLKRNTGSKSNRNPGHTLETPARPAAPGDVARGSVPLSKPSMVEINDPRRAGAAFFNERYALKQHVGKAQLRLYSKLLGKDTPEEQVTVVVNGLLPDMRERRAGLLRGMRRYYEQRGISQWERARAYDYMAFTQSNEYLHQIRYGAAINASRRYYPGAPIPSYTEGVVSHPLGTDKRNK